MREKISCLIVDDEPAALDLLARYAAKTPFLELLGTMGSGLQVLEFLQTHSAPDLIFSDIQMPDLNGLELAKNLPPETLLIFTTAFDRYAIEGYKVNAVDYLLKPIDYVEFLNAATKARDKITAGNKEEYLVKNQTDSDYIFIRSEYKQLKIKFADILYIEGLKDYVKIHLQDAIHPILSLNSLKKLEEELPVRNFMRVHRSFIVALDKIEQVERNQIIIRQQRITVADQYRAGFQEFMNKNSL